MGFYKDNTVEVIFNGKVKRVSKGVAKSLKDSGKLDVKTKKTAKAKTKK
jgi:hypothetical protein